MSGKWWQCGISPPLGRSCSPRIRPWGRDLRRGGAPSRWAWARQPHQLPDMSRIRWGFRNGVWTFGAESVADYLRKTADYTLDGIAHRIACPTLILEAEGDQFAKGQAGKVNEALKCPHKYVMLHKSEGAETHCHVGAMRIAQQTMFDWLDETLG